MNIIVGFIIVFFSFSLSFCGAEINLTAKAQLLAGMQFINTNDRLNLYQEEWQQAATTGSANYYWNLNKHRNRINQLNKKMMKRKEIDEFLSIHFAKSYKNSRNILYLFSGPDFSYADLFFPHMENLVLIGQQPIGSFLDLSCENQLKQRLLDIGYLMSNIPFSTCYSTKNMNNYLKKWGIGDLLTVGIVLADYRICDYQLISLSKMGTVQEQHLPDAIHGIKIRYRKHKNDLKRCVYYFQHTLESEINPSLQSFIDSLKIDTAFYKGSGYATQKLPKINQFVLDKVNYIVQGDTGIPLSEFNLELWEMKLFGIYARPFKGNLNPIWGLQTDLRNYTLALIEKNASDFEKMVAQSIWGKETYFLAKQATLPPSLTWGGPLPFRFDYASYMLATPFKKFSSSMQYAIKKKS
jgi:hypothetical protein